MKTIKLNENLRPFFVGYEGENDARGFAFDYSAWSEEYGSGVLQMLLQRQGDADPYPVVLSAGEDGTAIWTPSATDTAVRGSGEIQLIYTVDEVVAKTAVVRVLIDRSLGASGDPPEPYEDWLDRLTALAGKTQQNAQAAEQNAENAAQSAEDASNSAAAASNSENNAKDSENAAKASEQAAAASEANALASEQAAKASENAAALSEGNARQSANAAYQSAGLAANSATEAANSAAEAYRDAERAEQAAATAGYLDMEIDDRGHLIYTRTDAVDVSFSLQDGHLIMEAI